MKNETLTELKKLLKNVPYVKEFYKNGKLKNPIKGSYQSLTATASRSERRKASRKNKLDNNRSKRSSIVVVGTYNDFGKPIKQGLIRTIQVIEANSVKKGRKVIEHERKTIVHYKVKSR